MSSLEEASSVYTGEDLLDCSRYGEVEDVEAILASGGVDANHQDAHGNTALHLSCANGHADVIRALIKAGANHLPNGAGNRPLQWAVQNKHSTCVETLVELYPEAAQMNVLDKNGFGKSALTDAFKSGDAEMVKMVLNHKSAEEDMLLSQSSLSTSKGKTAPKGGEEGQGAGSDGGGGGGGGSTSTSTSSGSGGLKAPEGAEGGDVEGVSITHELGFGGSAAEAATATAAEAGGHGEEEGDEDAAAAAAAAAAVPSFHLRELLIRNPDKCFGDDAREDTTGLNLWAAAVVLSRWVASPAIRARLEGKRVLELGAGCGAGGISAAVHGRPASMLLTDLNAETMANLAHNVEINRHRYHAESEVRAVTLDWGDESTWEAASPPVDVVLAADVVYQADATPSLLHTILSLLKPGGTFFHVSPVSERDGLEGFLANLGGEGVTTTDGVDEGEDGGGEGGVREGECEDGEGASGGFELVAVTDAPAEFVRNPLVSGSEDAYILHFHELPVTTFRLHEFRKRA